FQRQFHQQFGFRARNQSAFVALEIEAEEIAFSQDIRQRATGFELIQRREKLLLLSGQKYSVGAREVRVRSTRERVQQNARGGASFGAVGVQTHQPRQRCLVCL